MINVKVGNWIVNGFLLSRAFFSGVVSARFCARTRRREPRSREVTKEDTKQYSFENHFARSSRLRAFAVASNFQPDAREPKMIALARTKGCSSCHRSSARSS